MAMIRYTEASTKAYEILHQVQKEWFPLLQEAIIKILFDTKKRKKGRHLILASIRKSSDLIRKLTDNLADEGCDYIIFLDQVVFENISDEDRIRLIRHELRHCKITGSPEKPRYQIIPHDIEDFIIEIELNQDNVDWAKKVTELAETIYEQIEVQKKEDEKTMKGNTSTKIKRRKILTGNA
jgi:hypothetical protein